MLNELDPMEAGDRKLDGYVEARWEEPSIGGLASKEASITATPMDAKRHASSCERRARVRSSSDAKAIPELNWVGAAETSGPLSGFLAKAC
jgi:hypothetical protein